MAPGVVAGGPASGVCIGDGSEGPAPGDGAGAVPVTAWCIAPHDPLACPGPHEPAWPVADAPPLDTGVAVAAGAAGWVCGVDDEHAGRAAARASFRAQIEGRRVGSMTW